MKEALELEKKIIKKDQARCQILAIQGEVYLMGANDSEFNSFDKILEKLEKGEIAPSLAVDEAIKIKDSKQDYH